jgi:hypothetical protein
MKLRGKVPVWYTGLFRELDKRHSFFITFLLQRGSKNTTKELATYINIALRKIESVQLEQPLGTTCGPQGSEGLWLRTVSCYIYCFTF